MFVLIPLVFIVSSAIGVFAIVWRKKSYINKLYALNSAGSVEAGSTLSPNLNWADYGAEFFPEIKDLFEKIEFHKHKNLWLMEAEKLLRKIRLIFLRVDRLSDSLIKKIRKVHLNGRLDAAAVSVSNKNEIPLKVYPLGIDTQIHEHKKTISPNFLKNEEERLIMEIAKNPKDARLYDVLGDLYMEMNQFSDAKESYEAAIELNPKNELIHQKLSLALEKVIPRV